MVSQAEMILRVITFWFLVLSQFFTDGMGLFKARYYPLFKCEVLPFFTIFGIPILHNHLWSYFIGLFVIVLQILNLMTLTVSQPERIGFLLLDLLGQITELSVLYQSLLNIYHQSSKLQSGLMQTDDIESQG